MIFNFVLNHVFLVPHRPEILFVVIPILNYIATTASHNHRISKRELRERAVGDSLLLLFPWKCGAGGGGLARREIKK